MKFIFKLTIMISALITFAIEFCACMVIVLIFAHIFNFSYSPYCWIVATMLYLLYDKYVDIHNDVTESIAISEFIKSKSRHTKGKGEDNES